MIRKPFGNRRYWVNDTPEEAGMTPLDLSPFGFHGKQISVHKEPEVLHPDGSRVLFMLKERHKKPEIIERNVRLARGLGRLGITSCAGVEEWPFSFERASDEHVREIRSRMVGTTGNEESLMWRVGFREFGTLVKLLMPDLRVRSVEDPELHEAAQKEHQRLVEEEWEPLHIMLSKRRVPDEYAVTSEQRANADMDAQVEAQAALAEKFGAMEINIRRDGLMLTNLLQFWQEAGCEKAAIFNAGPKHIDRIKIRKELLDVVCIVIDQTL